MSYLKSSKPSAIEGINTTPLVDVMLVLLVIFMLASPVLSHNSPMKLPKHSVQRSELPEPERVEVLATGTDVPTIVHAGTRISVSTLIHRLKSEPHRPVQLQVADNVPYQHAVRLLAQLQREGLTEVRFGEWPSPSIRPLP